MSEPFTVDMLMRIVGGVGEFATHWLVPWATVLLLIQLLIDHGKLLEAAESKEKDS